MRARACAKESELQCMANKKLQTRFGNIKKLGWNPRNISDVAFTNLCESIFRDPDFMVARPIIIDENNDILGGNQRYTALQTIYEDLKLVDEPTSDCWKDLKKGVIPDNWVQQVTGWDEAKKKRFNLIDNSPAGIAGTFDYDILKNEFGLDILAESGIDLSNVMDASGMEEFQKTKEEAAETSDMGENSERNQIFMDARQKARDNEQDVLDVSFHCTFVFQSTEQKQDFLKQAGIETKYGLFANGYDLAKKMGIELIDAPLTVRKKKPDSKLAEMAMEVEPLEKSE